MSLYRIQIVRCNGDAVVLKPGGKGERDLVQSVVDGVMARGVGFFRTEATVRRAVEDALNEMLLDLKSEVRP